ncbi:hypothetical protein ACFOSV_03800 [Algoriphagus namhaensis]|uniref:Uncharacterized protein n=1 Tax=Algoriphagus namhaensis TaxID=915353 RepID=A0ABV8AR55_9BACT
MKKFLQNGLLLLSGLAIVWACDNGFSEVPIIDTPPTIQLGSISSGTTEGEDFRINVSMKDAIEGSEISQLGLLEYSITSAGVTVESGSEAISGYNQTVTITVPGGFPAGDYNFDVTVSDTNGNASVDNRSFTVAPARPAFDITGVWTMAPVAGAFAVGPAPGDGQWFTSSAGDVVVRACFFDDTYTFNADGTFSIDMGDQTWLETWQGVGAESCGTPVAPYNGGNFTYTYTSTALTLSGEGAHVGLPKVNNAGELPNVPVPNEITYTIVDQSEQGETRNMTLRIEAGSGVWWDFKLTSGPAPTVDIVGQWSVEPVAGSLGVGPTQGSTEWFAISAEAVADRACFYDDVYTFNEDGTFTIDMGDQTWLEPWQGVGAESCGTPVAPYDGNGTFNYEFDGSSLKVMGTGAHVALPKVNNDGELPNVSVPTEITYSVVSYTEDGDTKRMTLNIEAGSGVWWTYQLISK